MTRPRIFFFKVGSNSLKNPAITRMLRDGFPEADVMTVDVVEDIVMKSPVAIIGATVEAFRRYGHDIIHGRHDPRNYFPRLPSVHRRIKKWVQERVDPARTLFVFQNQSLFDSHHPEAPFYLYTDHTYRANFRYPPHRFFRPAPTGWDALESRFYENARLCFTTCEFTRDSLVKDYCIAPDKVVCIHTGANTAVPVSVPEHPFRGRIVFVGLDWERKGGPDLVAAFKKVRQVHSSAQLWVIGCRPKIEVDGMNCFGPLSTGEIAAKLHEADVFCMPSYWDTSPMALAEAALHGLPAISTTVGGIPDRVVDGLTGYLVSPGDVGAITAALLKLFDQPSLAQEMGRRAYTYAKDRFTWPAVAQKLEKCIRSTLQPQASGVRAASAVIA